MTTKVNIKYIIQEIDEKNAIYTEMQIKLDEIYQRAIGEKWISKFAPQNKEKLSLERLLQGELVGV